MGRQSTKSHRSKATRLDTDKTPTKNENFKYLVNFGLCITLSLTFGFMHMRHIETLFENDKHFSHLSNLERELSFRTEAALYYHYFKILAVDNDLNPSNASFWSEIGSRVVNDDRTEHPHTINALKRFNLYPEVVLAGLYRWMNGMGMLERACWQVDRDSGMPPIMSCDGHLDPMNFYVKGLFDLNEIMCLFSFLIGELICRFAINLTWFNSIYVNLTIILN